MMAGNYVLVYSSHQIKNL